ncbi:uncharacterized protein EI90DRAFT_3048519 [Cantharellus anzutake]|uniref:uncharacterized protein n=1 Tax=Cantharellus anzutake TaxID=1750568 RepID=UPI001907F2C8|nr:uncharacterized protein EI90DRAFT_3048519 [Cantharellus anzutake]KAF8335479.1 hypothetical protein EI90DRAFT_3048519 [Cantharellus anzutake]
MQFDRSVHLNLVRSHWVVQLAIKIFSYYIMPLCTAQAMIFLLATFLGSRPGSSETLPRHLMAAGSLVDVVCSTLSSFCCSPALWLFYCGHRQPGQSSGTAESRQAILLAELRSLAAFLSIVILQLPRGLLLIFWPNEPLVDVISAVTGPVYFLVYLQLVAQLSPLQRTAVPPGNTTSTNSSTTEDEVIIISSIGVSTSAQTEASDRNDPRPS